MAASAITVNNNWSSMGGYYQTFTARVFPIPTSVISPSNRGRQRPLWSPTASIEVIMAAIRPSLHSSNAKAADCPGP
ncbi:hypothetical protein CRG98_025743 [Punica granatum]|uniref:Uncharacterized protein n=1 Tax=Punica granatum TaxID=22663 RepID=A0A2I0JC64_PUNGR|nr:hypothetical protein CRG98_025743 [Punica granatum]